MTLNKNVDGITMKAPRIFFSTLLLLLSQSGQLQTPAQSFVTNWEEAAADLKANRALWESHNVRSYSFVSDKSCFGCRRYNPARLSISGDAVEAAVRPATGEAIPRAVAPDFVGYAGDLNTSYETFAELFSIVEAAITNHWGTTHAGSKASNFSVEYDDVYGYPTRISVDYSRGLEADGSEFMMSDSGFTYSVSEFKPAQELR